MLATAGQTLESSFATHRLCDLRPIASPLWAPPLSHLFLKPNSPLPSPLWHMWDESENSPLQGWSTLASDVASAVPVQAGSLTCSRGMASPP